MTYDSTQDTLDHIARVAELLRAVRNKLDVRASVHDNSKLQEPEKSGFDACIPKLKDLTYGSPEYRAALREIKPALEHHYAHNSHHPEHYPLFKCVVCKSVLRPDQTWVPNLNDKPPEQKLRLCSLCCPQSPIYECEAVPYVSVDGMTLLDVVEMLMDWKAATERMKDGGDIRKSLEHNTGRFNLSPQLASILANTIKEMGW